ncbi:MAG: TA system VapC family ribonuclease toxin [Cyanobacteriota bacterium]
MPACLLDVGVWLAAGFAAHPAHGAARRVLAQVSAAEPALWCRATQQSFLRLASTPVITAAYGVPKATNADAWVALEAFLALPQVDLIDEPPELTRHWRQLGAIEQTAPKRWMDAYLAAFAMAAGVLFVSLDRDFSHFEQQGLKFQLLLADGSGGKSA